MNVGLFLKRHTILVFLAILIIFLAIISWQYIAVAIIAASLAVVGMPVYKKLRSKMPAPLSAVIVTTMICVIIVGILSTVVIVLLSNTETLSQMITTILSWFSNLLNLNITITSTTGQDIVTGILSFLTPEVAFTAISYATYLVVSSIIFYALLYLFLIFGERIWADIKSIVPEKSQPSLILMGQKTREILFALYVVHVLIAIITFAVAIPYALLLGVGIETALFYAVLCGIFALIPVVGPIIIIVFIGLYYLALGQWYQVILTATLGYFLTCILTDMILRPRFTAKTVKIRPMLMFLGFFGGAALLGLVGFVLGPVLLVLTLTGYEIFFKEMREVKQEIDSIPSPETPQEKLT